MNASRSGRAVGAWAHLLLVVVLALGVFVMHTVGHPDSPSAHPPAHTPAAMAPAAHGGGAQAAPHAPGMRMDMASLCVAVLGAAVLLVLLGAALRRGTGRAARPGTGATLLPVPRPPPRAPDLALLSILRI
ncbi:MULTISPECIES: DUF6153 family protein [unclassified Streptomyces]|uniref:DUF6153 family protein n=1 Tax=unclassified Streptomyces TaxID=2593676 RepID=UPI002E348150|nr:MULTISPECIES: DUF6153 family protein [unclassified Streptomyces]WUC63735.1 DUF6153 family protein [Streptomyces sp. NBC_00539]